MTFLSGCQTTGEAPISRDLPHGSNVVLTPAPKSNIGPGADARVAWKREEARADNNEARLIKSRQNYDGVRATYSEGN
jgi:hypothetical protein